MHKLTALILGASGLLCLLSGYVQAAQWDLKREQADIRIHQQATATGFALTRGVMEVPASLDSVLTVMRDPAVCPRWVYACKERQLVRQDRKEQRLDYTVIDSPLWFADRDMYIYSSASFDRQQRIFSIRLEGRDTHSPEKAGRVRIRQLWGAWILQESVENNRQRTQITYQIHGNPQLPASALLDAYMVESVFQTLSKLRSLAVSSPYENSWIPDLH